MGSGLDFNAVTLPQAAWILSRITMIDVLGIRPDATWVNDIFKSILHRATAKQIV